VTVKTGQNEEETVEEVVAAGAYVTADSTTRANTARPESEEPEGDGER
jgi:hypothetical protein